MNFVDQIPLFQAYGLSETICRQGHRSVKRMCKPKYEGLHESSEQTVTWREGVEGRGDTGAGVGGWGGGE